MKLSHLSNLELHSQTVSKAECERVATIEILWHLRENEKRMLYAERGFRDLKEYCVKDLKYSEGSAWRRISAMRLLKEVPEVESKIHSGKINLTQLAMAKAHFREVKSTTSEKQSVLATLENQTAASTARLLAEMKPEPVIDQQVETERPLKGNMTHITFVIDAELCAQLDEIQILLGKSLSKLELFKLMTQQTLEKLKSVKKRKAQPLRSRPASRKSRYISKSILDEVKIRDQHRCQFVDPLSARQCQAQFDLQYEHRRPFSNGGRSTEDNLELLCSAHNRLRAVQHFGVSKMSEYIPSLK